MNSSQREDFQILYVEDDDDAFDAWGELLKTLDTSQFERNSKRNAEVTRARTQVEALARVEAAGNRGFDLVILDLRYPLNDQSQPDDDTFQGLTWLPELSQRLPQATIAVFTAYSIDRYMQNAVTALLKDGAHEFIPKGTPWPEMELRLRVAWRFARSRREKQILQQETIGLLRSRAVQIHLTDAAYMVDSHISTIRSLVFDLDRMGSDGQVIAEKLRGRLEHLNSSIRAIVAEASRHTTGVTKVMNLSEWLRDSLYWHSSAYRDRQVLLKWPIDSAIPIRSYLDDVRVVVHELLQNALCSVICSGRSDGMVTVRVADSSGNAEIIVEDNGIGFSTQDLADGRLFVRGYSKWPVKVIDNQGMGLNIAKRLINNLGGSLTIGNKVNSSGVPGTGAAADSSFRTFQKLSTRIHESNCHHK